MDSKRFGMELEVSPGSHESTGLAFVFAIRTESPRSCYGPHPFARPSVGSRFDRVRNDQEHRMIHWVQLLMQPGQQRSGLSTGILFRIVQLCQALQRSSARQSVLLANKVDSETSC